MSVTADARTRILDAAERLFAQRGFDGTATSIIAEMAAVPKGLLFYYFPAKKDILATLVGERFGRGVIVAAPFVVPGNPVKALLDWTDRLFQVRADSDVLRVILWREKDTHPEVKTSLAAHRLGLLKSIEDLLAASLRLPVAAGRLRAAAQAWMAIVTTSPLDELSATGSEALGGHVRAELAALAELLCTGLTHGETFASDPHLA
ncbi:TetR/AcrR family transcriptional regulator [Homoserinimonas sp. OAct 916]|uniref:TetR/AcrR family transcriptional regulator n=1 Tax=Homoserinimonas sp. OAct 916 TaxID=2211450 RepID=UPI000DBE2E43|nr:TetR/AcrR family transcriptional regulator [Homoserinimonas sp. OAct 916]